MELCKIDPELIIVGKRLRPLDPAKVEEMMDSFVKFGQQTPISVWAPDTDTIHLVAGNHRLAAAKGLGLAEIDCVVVEMDETDRRLWEIAENLHRSELTEDERRQHIAEWVRLTEEKLRHGGAVSDAPGGRGNEGGIRAAARELNIPEATARRAVKAESLPAEAKAMADEAGLGTVARAKAASAPDPAAELRRLRAEKDAAEAARRNREADRAIAHSAAQEFAEWLFAHGAASELPQIIAWVEGSKPKDLIAALKRIAA